MLTVPLQPPAGKLARILNATDPDGPLARQKREEIAGHDAPGGG
jgi:hypothetical protein